MGDFKGSKWPKASTKKHGMTKEKQDRQLKMIVIALWETYRQDYLPRPVEMAALLDHTMCMHCFSVIHYDTIGSYSHIEKRSTTPESKYAINNIQILCNKCHEKQEGTGLDLRPDGFIEWLKLRGVI